MLTRGCSRRALTACPQEHSRALGNGNWYIDAHAELGTYIKCNGSITYAVRCHYCGSESSSINKAIVNGLISRGRAILWERNEIGDVACVVRNCTEPGYEYHHFAPCNTFPDADDWPHLPLCRPHHQYWHQMMDGYRWSKPTVSQLNTAHNNQLKEITK